MISGNPLFRFTLSHNLAGSLTINDPIGWVDTKLVLERDEQFHSLIERFDGAFQFYGQNGRVNGGIDFIRGIENAYGVDADLIVSISISFDNGNSFENIYSGLYDFSENEETNLNKIKSAILRDDFWTKFINRMETSVDIQKSTGIDGGSVDVISPITLSLSPQPIEAILQNKQKKGFNSGSTYPDSFSSPDFQNDIPSGGFAQINLDDPVLNELTNNYNIPFSAVDSIISMGTFMAPEFPSELTFDIKISLAIFRVNFVPGFNNDDDIIYSDLSGTDFTYRAKVWIKIGSDPAIEFTRTDHSHNYLLPIPLVGNYTHKWSVFTYTGTSSLLPAGTPIKIYVENTGTPPWGYRYNTIEVLQQQLVVLGDESNNIDMQPIVDDNFPGLYITGPGGSTDKIAKDFHTPSGVESYIKITGKTIFPETTAPTFLIHDVARSIIDRVTNTNNSVISSYLGNSITHPSYVGNGCGSRYVNIKGLHLRGYTLSEKQFFISFKEFWDGINPILNLGLGYTNENKIEIEKMTDFYDPSISTYFDNVFDIVRRYDNDVIFNKIDIGYSKWQSENIQGIDDPQTKRSYASRFKKVGKAISLISGFIAASFSIETTRRATKVKSADYKYDDETFIVAIDGIDSTPYPETAENFSSITNLKFSEDRYNSRITPARNFLRWIKYFNGALQKYIGSEYKFVSGEGNYDMSSLLNSSDCEYDAGSAVGPTVSEKENMFVHAGDYMHLPDLFEINMTMTWDQYKSVRNNRKKAIGISQTHSGHVAFFIKILEYDVCHSKARVVAWPHTPFSLQKIDFVPPIGYCEPIPPVPPPDIECGDNGRWTEDLQFRIIETGECREIE